MVFFSKIDERGFLFFQRITDKCAIIFQILYRQSFIPCGVAVCRQRKILRYTQIKLNLAYSARVGGYFWTLRHQSDKVVTGWDKTT